MASKHDIILILEAVGTSGLASMIVAVITSRLSGGDKQESAQPNGVRIRLQDEVIWLRQQLAVAQLGGFQITPPTSAPPPEKI